MTLSPQHQAGPRFTFHVSRFTVPLYSMVLALLCLVGTACGTTSQTGEVIFDDPRGTVSLQTIPDPSFQASHPIKLEPALLSHLLAGLEIRERGIGPHRRVVIGFAGQPSTYPLFSEDQIQFLAPLLAEGLRNATPSQSIEFRVVTTHRGSNRLQSPTTETTAGSFYAHGQRLYVILSQFRYNPMRTNLDLADMTYRSQEPLDYSGLRYRTLGFTPKAAIQADSPNPPTLIKSGDRFVAVDYQLLGQIIRAAEGQARSTEALAQEIDMLKQELESMKKHLGIESQGQDSPRQNAAPLLKQ